jgi:hypothetical protein
MEKAIGTMNRRKFLNATAKVIGGSAALGSSALSYGRIAGANDRISLGHIGIGNRGRGLDEIVSHLKDSHKVEMTAVCDLWSVNREKRKPPTTHTMVRRREPSKLPTKYSPCTIWTPSSFRRRSIPIHLC